MGSRTDFLASALQADREEVHLEVRIAEVDSDWEIAGRLLIQLRSAYDLRTIVSQMKAQQKRGYTVVYIKDGGAAVCAAGFVIETRLAWEKHMYIEDLVTDAQRRSSGIGKVMLDWLKSYAKENGCDQIHLDSGVQRFPAHRFYLREGFNIASHHFSIANLK
ncbi:MAG: GNAT family N-acetyltransferase [Desulfurellaceae bacterium]|nr:GNAT family N-acetyltransferase [Desulfurellaceae bacterium]